MSPIASIRTRRPITSKLKLKSLTAIIKATALEVLSEPLSLLVLMAGLVLAVVTPVFHYHQFGEATRMARDAGLSSLFTCTGVIAVFSTIRSFRREVESGTLEMALARPVSRGGFFIAKSAGCALAMFVFVFTLFAATVTTVIGAEVGGEIAEKTGALVSIWGPSVAAGVGTIIVPLLMGALMNRFFACRFVLSAISLMFLLSLLSAVVHFVMFGCSWFLRLAPVALLAVILPLVLLSAAAAFSIRFAANAAATLCGVVLVFLLPFVGNYYLADALAKGGSVSWSYVGFAVSAALLAILAFLILGGMNVRRYDH